MNVYYLAGLLWVRDPEAAELGGSDSGSLTRLWSRCWLGWRLFWSWRMLPFECWVHRGCWLEGSVPCPGGFSMGLIECSYNMAAGFPRDISYWLHRSALLSRGGDHWWTGGLLRDILQAVGTSCCLQLGNVMHMQHRKLENIETHEENVSHHLVTQRKVLWISLFNLPVKKNTWIFIYRYTHRHLKKSSTII